MWRMIVVVFLALTLHPLFAESVPEAKGAVVTLSAIDEKVSAVAQKISDQTGARILIEKTADIKVTANIEELPIEEALTAMCKAADLVWRKIHIRADSPMLKTPDSLASTVRLVKGMNFPDFLLEASMEPESMVHMRQRPVVDSIPDKIRKDMGLVSLYLITNDKAAKIQEEEASSKLARYNQLQKESWELFMEMTPEEREQAMASGMQMMQQLDQNFMSEMMKTFVQNPNMMAQAMQSQMDFLYAMPMEDRRAMMRMQMQMQFYIPEELKALLMEDAMAVMKEMGLVPEQ